METLTRTEWKVLNATAADVENLGQIYKQLRDVPLSEVADAVRSLTERGLLVPRRDEDVQSAQNQDEPGLVWRSRFAMTPRGREAWTSSGHAADALVPEGRLFFGAWKDIAVDIPLEVFEQNRREMWGDVSGASAG